jgi:hypothetical protein
MSDASFEALWVKPIRRMLRTLAVMTAVLYLILLAAGVGLYLYTSHQTGQNRELARQGERARSALCVFRADLERHADSAKAFLRDNPRGIPGITPAVIRNGITNQEKTIAALAGLDC